MNASPKLLIVFFFLLTFTFILPQPVVALTVINDCTELQNMRNNLTEDYELGGNIDCSIPMGEEGFEPIGDGTTPFEGTFDGKGFTIYEIYANRPSEDYVGLFGRLSGATISNVIINGYFTGRNYVGVLAGAVQGDPVAIDQVGTNGEAIGSEDGITNNFVGGLIGSTWTETTITNSYATGSVESTVNGTAAGSYAGGLIGNATNATITNTYSAVSVYAYSSGAGAVGRAGGIVGALDNSVIRNSFGDSFPEEGTIVGGVAGDVSGSTITNSYSILSPLYGNESESLIDGGSQSGVDLSSFFQTDPLHAVYLGSPSWDFENIWSFTDQESLPVLFQNPDPEPSPSPTTSPSTTPAPRSGNSDSRSSSPSAPSCTDQAPHNAPDLFQINVKDTQATLYFAPASGANTYFISYGNGENTHMYGVEFETGYSSGVLAYTINHLSPNNPYSFIVRGGNGCMPGNWSNTMRVTTPKSMSSTTIFYKNFASSILLIGKSI